MNSTIFCETLKINTEDFNHKNREDDFSTKLYKIELLKYQELISELIQFLSDSERNRSERYHFQKDQNRFIICRALLKFLLAKHINQDITKIILDIDGHKKPYLSSHPSVFYNISHANNYALIAIGSCELGVDIEFINMSFDYVEILPSVFNTSEINLINTSKDKRHSFYKFWTRKEAIVKAIGKGIDDDLKNIPVADGFHSVPSALIYDFNKINVFSFNLNDAYVGALALPHDLDHLDKIAFCSVPSIEKLKSLFL